MTSLCQIQLDSLLINHYNLKLGTVSVSGVHCPENIHFHLLASKDIVFFSNFFIGTFQYTVITFITGNLSLYVIYFASFLPVPLPSLRSFFSSWFTSCTSIFSFYSFLSCHSPPQRLVLLLIWPLFSHFSKYVIHFDPHLNFWLLTHRNHELFTVQKGYSITNQHWLGVRKQLTFSDILLLICNYGISTWYIFIKNVKSW